MNVLKTLFFSDEPWYPNQVLGIVRILVGFFMLIHGVEVFSSSKMADYATWDVFKKFPSPASMAYIGKGSEFLAGIFITFGWYTKLGAWIMVLAMLYIVFFVGHGKFWYDDQHPFLFVLIAFLFIALGSGSWALDKLKKQK